MNRDEFLIKDLPDPEAARRFLADLAEKHPSHSMRLTKHEGLFSDVLTLASYSPLLATTLLQNPGYFDWLKRRRADSGGRRKDELLESLARFSLTNSQIETQVLLARFRRRELLRIFLRDVRRLATIAEITEEISNLADAILEHALRIAKQELENRFGLPLETDEKRRSRPAGFCIVSLGKLGSKELNYSSDIDLLFMYSADGMTAATGTKAAISNREFSIKLAERVIKLAGEQTGEGSAYRVDLRLRPHGRIGPLAMSVADTARYYLTEARGWERQVMIRSRASAGDAELFRDFFSKIEEHVFSADESVQGSLENVRRSKEQINKGLRDEHGFNIKLGRGGIREIEFVAQALQLAYGGDDRWLRASHTLISLARLGDRGLITSTELTQLFDAYDFLRRVEHILQMEHGLQTHVLSDDPAKRKMVAAKMSAGSPRKFENALALHTRNVSRVFERVFNEPYGHSNISGPVSKPDNEFPDTGTWDTKHSPSKENEILNRLSAESPRFAGLAAADPDFLDDLREATEQFPAINYREYLFSAVESEANYRGKLAALRKSWHRAILRIAASDLFGGIDIKRSKMEQTALAEASIDAAFAIAAFEMSHRLSVDEMPLQMAALALGKLGGGGIDYDSDLDLVLVYNDDTELPSNDVTPAEFFGRGAELFVTALSSMTRDGSLYRVDLRLRPHGKNGPSAVSARALTEYIAKEAAIWELLAYMKFRGSGGDSALAQGAENSVREIIQTRSSRIEPAALRDETLRVRQRLEKERAGRLKANEVDIKYGAGGLLDIYFATRFLQLRDQVPDAPDCRSTDSILKGLLEKGSLTQEDFEAFSSGYAFLSELDHNIRLTIGRTTRVPQTNHKAMAVIAGRMKAQSASELIEHLTVHRIEIRRAFDLVLQS
jgi:glutamate-ammonia-ligase adenylyltransferase